MEYWFRETNCFSSENLWCISKPTYCRYHNCDFFSPRFCFFFIRCRYINQPAFRNRNSKLTSLICLFFQLIFPMKTFAIAINLLLWLIISFANGKFIGGTISNYFYNRVAVSIPHIKINNGHYWSNKINVENGIFHLWSTCALFFTDYLKSEFLL